MADSELTCDSCQHCAGDCVETLPCGHYLCGVCSCRMESLTIMCPLCEGCEPEDCDILSCSEELSIQSKLPVQILAKEILPTTPVITLEEKKMELSVFPKEYSPSTCSVASNMSVDDNSGSQMRQVVNDSNVVHVMDAENANPGNFEDNFHLKIDEALIIANDTLHHLDSAFQILKNQDTRNKMLEKRISNSIHETFGKLALALKKRKSDLLTDLRAVSEVYSVELQNAMKNLEEQKKCLETRVAFAKGLKQSPSVTIYCDLNQLVADLKVSFKNEFTLDSLKDSSNIRFTIDSNTMLKTFKDLGMICTVGNPKCQFPPSKDAAFKDSRHLDVKPERSSPGMHLKDCTKGFVYEQCESDFECMETYEHKMDTTNQPATEKYLYNSLSQSLSTPDVIIEEIIEEDQPCLFEPEKNITLEYTKGKHLKKEFSNCRPKRLKKSQKMMGTCAPFCQKKISQEFVYLSHFEHPCNFYVHSVAQKKQVIVIERKLTSLSQTCSQCCPTDVLELGELIAFKSIVDNKWCRGSITELIPLESKCILKPCGPTRYKIEDIMRLTLFLIDHGRSETVVAARFAGSMCCDSMMDCETNAADLHKHLTKLSSADEGCIRFLPPLVIHCSLNIMPRSPDVVWTREIKDQVSRMVGNKCVSMRVIREEHNKLIVDLRTPFENKINSNMPLSLRDALVFMELAEFPSNVSTVLSDTAVTPYKDPLLPKNMTEVVVLVCHVNDPSDFYIHLTKDSEYGKMMDKIQEVYNNKDAEDWRIVFPIVHQPCIAKFETGDEHWYRAEMIALPNPQEAVIKYVDFGNIATVNIAGLRRLKEEFMTLPCKAIGCRLAYIQPFNAGLWWSSEACNLFEALASFKHLRCNSIGVLLENKLSVELFDISPIQVSSINSLLVKENVASFIQCTSDSSDLHLPLKEIWDPVADLLPDPMEMCMDGRSLFERKELDVYISHVVSPSKIYVQWLTTESILKSLQASMFERYENSKPEPIQWQVDMLAAVQLQYDKKWCRGKIINIISDQEVEVFCFDFGVHEVTVVSHLRKLDESLMTYGTMCLECALMDIQPAGGSPNWTATACDKLFYYLKGATVTMIIEDNASHWPLPVRILSKNEANELVDVSEFLVKRGLALRDRRINKQDSVLEANDVSTEQPDKSCLEEHSSAEVPVSEISPECAKTVTSEQSNIEEPEEPVMEPMVDEPYLPPLLPEEETFLAKVNHVGEDGTIYIIQECLENELGVLMLEIQESFKCLGLMAPYSWKKGEGCLIKGSDTMSYRGKVLDILGGDMITVQYEDFGYTEKIPKCHLYPSVYNSHVPRFCIPCQLNDILPVGDNWQPDAIQFLKELLLERVVTIHIVEPPTYPNGIASVHIYCGNAPVSAILEQYAHGIPRGCEKNDKIETHCTAKIPCETIWGIDFQGLLQNDLETPLLPPYSSEPLPRTGELFKVEVTHIQTPSDVFIRILNEGEKCQSGDSGDGDCDPLNSMLKKINSKATKLPSLTDFRTAMSCLAVYRDNLFHRAKLQSIKSYDPVSCVVEFVDYGSTAILDTGRLCQLPASLLQYPVKAIKVKLAGFKPPKEDFQADRLQYCPEWSIKALFEMIDLVQKKTLSATCVAGSENTVFLYDDNQHLVHKPLITMGLADLDEM